MNPACVIAAILLVVAPRASAGEWARFSAAFAKEFKMQATGLSFAVIEQLPVYRKHRLGLGEEGYLELMRRLPQLPEGTPVEIRFTNGAPIRGSKPFHFLELTNPDLWGSRVAEICASREIQTLMGSGSDAELTSGK